MSELFFRATLGLLVQGEKFWRFNITILSREACYWSDISITLYHVLQAETDITYSDHIR